MIPIFIKKPSLPLTCVEEMQKQAVRLLRRNTTEWLQLETEMKMKETDILKNVIQILVGALSSKPVGAQTSSVALAPGADRPGLCSTLGREASFAADSGRWRDVQLVTELRIRDCDCSAKQGIYINPTTTKA